jgi:hypothetical protein
MRSNQMARIIGWTNTAIVVGLPGVDKPDVRAIEPRGVCPLVGAEDYLGEASKKH